MLKKLILAGLMIGASQAASAATMTRTYTITSLFTTGSPVSALTNSYTITFDPTISVDDRAVTTYLSSSTLPIFSAPVGYSTFANSTLIFGKNPGVNGVTTMTNDFYSVININAMGDVTGVGYTTYTSASTNTFFNSTSQIAVVSPLTAVPEPASWAMMIGGVGLVGGALRRRSKVTTRVSYAA